MSFSPQDQRPDSNHSFQKAMELLVLDSEVEKSVFAFLQHQIHDVIFVLEVEPQDRYRFIYVNAAFQATTGLPPSAVVGKYVEEVIPSKSIDLVQSKYQRAIATGRSVHWDEFSTYPTGIKVGEVTVTPVLSSVGACSMLIGTVHDVTERYRAQERLTELEERSRLALEASGSGAFDWHSDTNEVALSKHCQHILGYVSDKVNVDVNCLDKLVHPEDLSRTVLTLQDVRSGAVDAFSLELRIRHLYGHWVWLHCKGRAFQDRDACISRVFGVISDITKEKEAEEVMERASLVFAHSSEAIAIADPAGRIIMVNPKQVPERFLT